MEQKSNPKIERVLALVEPGRRDALRKILATAAYAVPVVASFSLDAEAAPVDCFAGNQTCIGTTFFVGTVKCKGLSLDRTPTHEPQHVDMKFDVLLDLCEGPTGGSGRIGGGPTSLVVPPPAFGVSFVAATFPGKGKDTLGFAVHDCRVVGYYETGEWTHDVKNDGTETLKGKSRVLINTPAAFVGTAYTLECEYDLKSTSGPV